MFKIILFTPENDHPQEKEILHALTAQYGISIHLRKPFYSAEAYTRYLDSCNTILPDFVLHQYHNLASRFPVKGIHLKETDRSTPESFQTRSRIISTSIHAIEDFSALTYPFEYVFFSPLFESISKLHYGKQSSDLELQQTLSGLKDKNSIPVIGLGGIHEGNIAQVKNSGFDGAALLGAIWMSQDPVKAFAAIYDTLDGSRNSK
jgi:thiamine-phosphate pyrophosphorylase